MSNCIICKTNCSPVKLACWKYNKRGKMIIEGYASVKCLKKEKELLVNSGDK